MKKNVSSIILVLILCFTVVGITLAENMVVDSMDFQGEGVELTLNEALDVVLKNNVTIKNQEIALEKAKLENKISERNIKKMKKGVNAPEISGAPMSKSVNQIDTEILELTSDFSFANAERNYQATLEKIKSDLEGSYFGLIQAQEVQEINRLNLDLAKDLHEKTQKKYDLGLIAKQEVINSELNLVKAENEYSASEDTVKKAKMALNMQLGNDLMTKLKVKDKLVNREYEIESIADAIGKAFLNRNEIKASEFNYELQKLNTDIEEKRYGKITDTYKQLELALEETMRSLEDTKKMIEMEVRSNYLDVMQKKAGIKSAEKSVELSEEALRLTQLSYDVGMSVLTDVQSTQTTLMQAKLGLSKAILDYNLAILNFEDSIAVGRMAISK